MNITINGTIHIEKHNKNKQKLSDSSFLLLFMSTFLRNNNRLILEAQRKGRYLYHLPL